MSDTDTRQREDTLYPQIVRAIQETPWAILEGTLATILDIVGRRLAGERFTAEEIKARVGDRQSSRSTVMAGPVAVLPVYGVIIPRATLFSEMSGGTSIQRLTADFRDALDDRDVTAIVLDIDSPGGMTDMVPEFAAELRAARGKKPIVAVANTRAASAAYWLGAQADEFVVTPSGDVGSIGVFAAHDDISGMQEKMGVKTTLVSAKRSPNKTLGNPYEPLSDEALAAIQERVDEMHAMFEADVAKGRRVSVEVVRSSYGQGRMFSAKQAKAAGMVDRVETLEATIRRLAKGRAGEPEPQEPETPELIEAAENGGQSFADARRAAIVAGQAVVDRVRAILAAPGGRLSAATRTELHEDAEAMQAAADAVRELAADTAAPEPEPEADDSLELEWAHLGLTGHRQ